MLRLLLSAFGFSAGVLLGLSLVPPDPSYERVLWQPMTIEAMRPDAGALLLRVPAYGDTPSFLLQVVVTNQTTLSEDVQYLDANGRLSREAYAPLPNGFASITPGSVARIAYTSEHGVLELQELIVQTISS